MSSSKPKELGSRDQTVYEVGYKKPPKHTRFTPGKSGNKRGRPKGAKSFKTDVLETLNAKVVVTQDGKSKRLSTQRAVLERLRQQALKGDYKAMIKIADLASDYQDGAQALQKAKSLVEADAAILSAFLEHQNKLPPPANKQSDQYNEQGTQQCAGDQQEPPVEP